MSTVQTNTTITVKRESRAGDNAGGKTVTLSTVQSGVSASRRFYTNKSRLQYVEGQAGMQEEREVVFLLKQPAPAVQIDDRVIDTGDSDKEYRVLHVRSYARTMQIDVRIMQ